MKTTAQQLQHYTQLQQDKLSIKQLVSIDLCKWTIQANKVSILKLNKTKCINCKAELTLDELQDIVNDLVKYKMNINEAESSLCQVCLNEATNHNS